MRAPARVEKFFRDEHFVPGFFQVVPVCEATGTRHLPLAQDRRRRDALVGSTLPALLEGLDWRRVHEARETAPPTQPG
jgi:hypothetical protein